MAWLARLPLAPPGLWCDSVATQQVPSNPTFLKDAYTSCHLLTVAPLLCRVLRWQVPPDAAFFTDAPVRVDSGVVQGDTVGLLAAQQAAVDLACCPIKSPIKIG